jgi:serine/threonine protein kinase/formylglycine-generating enzyme required for sulfatase activity
VADFKTALEALGRGTLKIEVLLENIDKVLRKKPALLNEVVAEMTEAYASGQIDAQTFAKLKHHAQQIAGGDAAYSAADRTVIATDATQILSEAEKTQIADEIRTQITNRTATESTATVDFDLSGPSTPTGGSWPTGGTSTSSTSSGWASPAQPQMIDDKPIGPGTVLKERFQLDEVLGVGGMGTVYRGRDLLKVEARDRNPWVALKVLNEDFKKHPDSFIALQREASRQQKLAHPNIATVYDFDRTGATVFITMELMEGKPLNDYIKKVVKPKGGMPFEEAFPIIRGLGHGLIYAHERKMVHSDFKPGNCFLLKDGNVKILDFGIARAVKNPGAQQGEGEKTLFDPGKLGALTPAYASAEMLDGLDPLPPDDLYALGCVAYELLTGRHPFNKLPHNQARENKLVPAPIKGLKGRQMKAIVKSLAYKRDDRQPTVDQFLVELEGKVSPLKNPFIVAPIALGLIIAIGALPAYNYYHQRQIDGIITDFKQGDPQIIAAKLELLPSLNDDDRKKVLDEAKDPILDYFEREIGNRFDVQAEKYDYATAKKTLDQAHALYPDSAKFVKIFERVEDNKNQLLSALTDRFNENLDAGRLLPDDAGDDIGDVLAVVTQLDSGHPLLKDARLPNAFATEADNAIAGNDLERAATLATAGLKLAPGDVTLVNVEDKIKAAVARQQDIAQAADIQKRLQDGAAAATALAEFKSMHDDVLKLAAINPTDPALTAVADRIQPLIDAELTALAGANDLTKLDALRSDYSAMLGALQLKAVNEKITAVFNDTVAKVGDAQQKEALRLAQEKVIEEGKAKVAGLLASPSLERDWETQVQSAMTDVETRLAADDAWLKDTREAIAKSYVAKASEARASQRFTEASALLERGERLATGADALAQERQQLAAAEEEFRKAEEEKLRLAKIESDKQTFLTQAKAKDVTAARQTLDGLKQALPADDPFLAKDVPEALGDAYHKLALSKAEAGDHAAALKFAKAGLEVAPELSALKQAVREYTVEGNAADLRKVFANASALDLEVVQKQLAEVKGIDPKRHAEVEAELAEALVKRIESMQATDAATAGTLTAHAQQLFPNHPAVAKLAPVEAAPPPEAAPAAPAYAGIAELVQAGSLSKALGEIKTALSLPADAKGDDIKKALEQAPNAELDALYGDLRGKRTQAETAYDGFREAFKARKYDEANTQLAKAESVWKDSSALAKARRELDAAAKPAAATPAAPGEGAAPAARVLAPPPPSKQPCTSDLAGFGERKKGSCFEMVDDKARGPVMVVIPAGGKAAKPFAIGKYEVTVADYNAYCRLSGACTSVNTPDKNAPITNVSLKDVEAYAKWLSERTGKVYRLPTVDEWVYAADAGGKQPKKDYNCRVAQGSQILKGQSLMGANTGKPNGWGLYNYVGNAQEWVSTGQGVVVRGGAYTDNFGSCEIALEKASDGQANEATGFRLVQEMG